MNVSIDANTKGPMVADTSDTKQSKDISQGDDFAAYSRYTAQSKYASILAARAEVIARSHDEIDTGIKQENNNQKNQKEEKQKDQQKPASKPIVVPPIDKTPSENTPQPVSYKPVKTATLPFIIYGVVAVVACFAWYALCRANLTASIMADHDMFMTGIVVLIVLILSGIAVAACVTYISATSRHLKVFDAFALSFGKVALVLLVIIIAWTLMMLALA